MRVLFVLIIFFALPAPSYGATISSLDFEFGEKSEQTGVGVKEDKNTFKYVEQPEPSRQIIHNQGTDIIIQKKSSNVFHYNGSRKSGARNNIGGLKTE